MKQQQEATDERFIDDATKATHRERAQMLRAVARAPRDDDSLTIERGAQLIDHLLDQLEAVQEALARHPKCDKYDEDDVVSCGWKSAVRDITWAVNQ